MALLAGDSKWSRWRPPCVPSASWLRAHWVPRCRAVARCQPTRWIRRAMPPAH